MSTRKYLNIGMIFGKHSKNRKKLKILIGMGKVKRIMYALLLIAGLTCSISCKKDDENKPENPTGGTKTGIYMGIIGFNDDLYGKDIGILDKTTSNSFKSFIDGMEFKHGTVLYHAVYTAIDNLEKATLPNDLVNASIVTFTDGLDQGSYMLNDNYSSGADYLKTVSNRISAVKIKGLNISAHSIGLKGKDVLDDDKFWADLRSLASNEENATRVEDMDGVNRTFKKIAEALYKESTTQILNITMPAQDPGKKIRFTFDNINDAKDSEIYIEGTYSSNHSLSNIVYNGVSCSSGTTISGTVSGINVTFSFINLMDNSGGNISTNNIKQWAYINSSSQWQINSEFDPGTHTNIDIDRKSAVIMLVLDCSSSLGDDFSKMQSAAKNFIDVLLDNTTTSVTRPIITIDGGADFIAIDLANPINWEVPVTVISPDEDMYSISVYIIGADEQKYPVAVITGAGLTDPRAWEHTYKPTDADLGAVMFLLNEMQVKPVSFNVDVNIVNKPTFSASKPFSIKGAPVVVDTPLSDPAAFSWERVGGGAATGNFSTFGLKWVQNGAKANFVYIERDKADKFVQFTAAQWAQITTKEALKAAVDSELAPNMDRFKGISADATKDYDYVLATKYGDNYYLIHITKGTVSIVSAGIKIVIDGQSKN